MIGLILSHAECNPTVLVGGELEEIHGNVKVGNGKFLVAEACEYFDNFLTLRPYIGILLNIDRDHLDYFRDIEHIKQTFRRFAELIPGDGCLVACLDDPNVQAILDGLPCSVITYGKKAGAEWRANNIDLTAGGSSFDVYHNDKMVGRFTLSVPGIHNVLNSLAATAVCERAGLGVTQIAQGLRAYHGIHRRFDFQGNYHGAAIYDDYSHHPTEIRAALAAARTYNPERIVCVFQPHTYTRTKALMQEFAHAFNDADLVIVTDIYAARESDTYGVSSAQLVEQTQKVHPQTMHINTLEAATDYLRKELRPGDLVITMGAGDVFRVGKMLLAGERQAL